MADLAHKMILLFLPKMATKYALRLWTAGVSFSETLFYLSLSKEWCSFTQSAFSLVFPVAVAVAVAVAVVVIVFDATT